MSDARRARVERFRGSLIGRARRVTAALLLLDGADAGGGAAERASVIEEAARDLHTLKGDARMLGLSEVSEVAHAAEAVLRSEGGARTVVRALDVVIGALELLPGPPEAEARARDMLAREAERLRHAPVEPRAIERTAGESVATGVAHHSGEEHASEEGASEEHSSEEHSSEKHSSEKHSSEEPSSEKHSSEEHFSEKHSSEEHSSERRTAERRERERRAHEHLAVEAAPPASALVTPPVRRERTTTVESRHIDQVCDGLSELVAEFRALHYRLRELNRARVLPRRESLSLLEMLDRITARTDDLTERAWTMRLVPVEPMLQDLARHARALAASQQKTIITTVRASGAQLERTMLEALWDPLLHLVNNAVDHGVEEPARRAGKRPEAELVLEAEQLGPNVAIAVSDDGAGIEPERVRAAALARGLLGAEEIARLDGPRLLQLLFLHGFSTRQEVSEISGRGVGLDVVRASVERLGGAVHLASVPGRGTRFRLELPVALGKEPVLVFESVGRLFGLPSRSVREIVRVPASGDTSPGEIQHGVDHLPLDLLDILLGVIGPRPRFALLLDSGGRRWAFGVTGLVGEHELVVRPVDSLLALAGPIASASHLPDGRLVLMLSASELIRLSAREGLVPTPIAQSELG